MQIAVKAVLCAAAISSVGCANLVDESGNRISLAEYDCVCVEPVKAPAASIAEDFATQLKFHVEILLLQDELWLKSDLPDHVAFARSQGIIVPEVTTVPTQDSPRVRFDYSKIHPAAREEVRKWEYGMYEKPKGNRPINLSLKITQFDFPSSTRAFFFGAAPSAAALVAVHKPGADEPLATAEVRASAPKAGSGFIGGGLVGGMLSSTGDKAGMFRMTGPCQLAQEVVKVLDRAKRFK